MSKKEEFIYPPEVTRAFFLKMTELAERSPPPEVYEALHKKLIKILGSEEALDRVYREAVEQLFDEEIWPPHEPAPADEVCQRH